ncbi:MAG: 5-oxoprolinase subunit PxpB [Nitrospira sp.]|nr:5-oxoprolinase subunit PxpB [Nitrospira sp.]
MPTSAQEEALAPRRIIPMGDSAVTVEFGDSIDPTVNALVISYTKKIREQDWSGIVDVVPTFRSVTIHFDPLQWDMASLADHLRVLSCPCPSGTESSGTVHQIPVLYGGDYGPDLDEVAAWAGLEPSTVIRLHASVQYRVYMIGFSPGFPYLGLVPPQLTIPRLATPRPRVPAGSVGIADRQTGIYPIATPGGWRLIGRTPIPLYHRKGSTPFLLKPGDQVLFRPITQDEFERLSREVTDEYHRSQQ